MTNFHAGMLFDRFILPPFSILDTMRGEWQKRKRKWTNLGIEAELGRNTPVLSTTTLMKKLGKEPFKSETSIFDPVLCELIYKWFNIPDGKIVDPFAGGSVRGLVAGYLGYDYTGIDLNEEQIEANVKNLTTVTEPPLKIPKWIIGDSENINQILQGLKFDFLFSCPPYYDLEVYTKKTNDLSNMSWEQFLKIYNNTIMDEKYARKLSNEECKILQGFPKEYKFYGGKTSVRKQIGNAVCPPIVREFFKQI